MKKFDNSYDRNQAVALARQLAGVRRRITIPEPKVQAALDSSQTCALPPQEGFDDRNLYRNQVWENLLNWAMTACEGLAAFVCDPSGLVIAEVGNSDESGEAMPSIVVSALGNLKRYTTDNQAPKLICMELNENWITALNINPSSGESLVVGLVSGDAPKLAVVRQIGEVFRERIAAV